jgi:hypothetical protein
MDPLLLWTLGTRTQRASPDVLAHVRFLLAGGAARDYPCCARPSSFGYAYPKIPTGLISVSLSACICSRRAAHTDPLLPWALGTRTQRASPDVLAHVRFLLAGGAARDYPCCARPSSFGYAYPKIPTGLISVSLSACVCSRRASTHGPSLAMGFGYAYPKSFP